MRNFISQSIAFLMLIFPLLAGQSGVDPIIGTKFIGKASYYAFKFHGRTTANGEKMDNNALTCAHRTLPFGAMLEVKNKKNGKSVIVRCNDRGPFSGTRVIDLSYEAAKQLDMITQGIALIEATVVGVKGKIIKENSETENQTETQTQTEIITFTPE